MKCLAAGEKSPRSFECRCCAGNAAGAPGRRRGRRPARLKPGGRPRPTAGPEPRAPSGPGGRGASPLRTALQCAKRIPNFELESAANCDTGSYYPAADVALAAPHPLLNRNQRNIRSAWAPLPAAEKELRRIERDLSRRLAAAFGPYASALQHLQTYTQRVPPNAKASLDLVATGHRQGEFGYLDLLSAQQTHFRVSLQYPANLKELWDRAVQIEGLLLSGGLAPVE